MPRKFKTCTVFVPHASQIYNPMFSTIQTGFLFKVLLNFPSVDRSVKIVYLK